MDTALEQQYKAALRGARDMIRELQAQVGRVSEPVAIIGMSCVFPGDGDGDADSPDRFGQLLRAGYDAVAPIPRERRQLWQSRHPDHMRPGSAGLEQAALLRRDIFAFDRTLFGQIPAEAAITDPQHRMLLELTWEALLDAGLQPSELSGSNGGVFAGKTGTDYLFDQLGTDRNAADDPYVMTGNMHSALPGRIAHFLDWHGPCVSVEAACATSLMAVMTAVNSLRAGECALAVAGAANLLLGPTPSHWLNAMHSLAPDGRCKAFAQGADGFGRGEGGGVVVLERLSDARRLGRRIHAVILGGATGSDGRSAGFTAPSSRGQRLVMRRALENAGIQAADVAYVETHGTGTPLGDPIEVESLTDVYGQRQDKLLIGAVKSNVAHLEAAAGMAGLIKTVLAVRDGVIPASINCPTLNSLLDWEQLPVEVVRGTRDWPTGHDRRIAGVSGFAISGSLVHLLVAGPPVSEDASQDVPPADRVLLLSARTPSALEQLAAGCADRLEQGTAFDTLCAAAVLRPQEPERLAVAAADGREAAEGLHRFAAGRTRRGVVRGVRAKVPPQTLFLCSGQGSQQPGMGRALARNFPVFREVLERCDALAAPRLGYSLMEVMQDAGDPRLQDTRCTQPVIYAHQAALAALWKSFGVHPDAVFGHSIGEYAAAHIAGVVDLATGLDIALTRGELAASVGEDGAMAAVLGGEDDVLAVLQEFPAVSIAAINGPSTVTIAGARADVGKALERLRAQGVDSRPLPVSHAFHCPLIEPMLRDFREYLRGQDFAAPVLPILSGCSGRYLDAETDWAAYFCRQTREPVRFSDAVLHAREQVFIELGASPTLTSYGRQCRDDVTWLFSENSDAGLQPLTRSLARLYGLGYDLDWSWLRTGQMRPEVMPPYPFEREHLIPDFVEHRPQDFPPPVAPDWSIPQDRANLDAVSGADTAVQLAILQCETFREICDMQQAMLGLTAGSEKQ